jgi:choline dehydrogenase-like flavoprotein
LPSSSVLVIEAGPAAPGELGINIPGKKGSTLGTVYDWNFTTVAQSNLKNRVIGFNRGKVLGGSSALNLLCYDRASATEYDGWEELGNPGWNWKNMLAAMIKAENFTGINTATYGSKGVGSDGPVKAVVNRWVPAQQSGFIPAVSQGFGLPNNRESLGGDNIGVMFQPSSIDPTHYNRSYSANAYLPLAGSNLAVSTNTRVVRIDFEQTGTLHRATGVTLQNGTTITARREIVLSAGTVQSPGILELSGIGQASVIATLNQSQLIDLPGVGENLQDHIRMQTSYQLKPNYTSVDIFKYNATYATQELNKWLAGEYSRWDYTGSGYLFADWETAATNYTKLVSLAKAAAASPNSTSTVSPVTQKKLDWLLDPSVPEVEAIFSDGYTGVKGYPAVNSSLYGQGFSTLIGGLMHPLGRGSIHINASQPYGNPVINPRYLSNEYDLAAMIEIAKFYRRVARTPPLADAFVTEYEPGYALVPLNATDDVWKQYVLNVTSTIYHPTGTCAMLPREDGGVVDPSLTVYGTTNLRIVDASIFPVQISAHIQTAVYGVAERAAELIIAKASCSKST